MGTIIGGNGPKEEITLCQFCNFLSIILLGILICAVSLFSAIMVRTVSKIFELFSGHRRWFSHDEKR